MRIARTLVLLLAAICHIIASLLIALLGMLPVFLLALAVIHSILLTFTRCCPTLSLWAFRPSAAILSATLTVLTLLTLRSAALRLLMLFL